MSPSLWPVTWGGLPSLGSPDTSTPLVAVGVPQISEVPMHLGSTCEELRTVTSRDTTHPGGCLILPERPNSPRKALILSGLSNSPKEMLTTLF